MGQVELIDRQLAELRAKRSQLQAVHKSLATTGALLGAPALARLMEPVHVHREYGGRGSLVAWLGAVLQAAGPTGVDTLTLARCAEERFQLAFRTEADRQRFLNNSVSRALRRMASLGRVEPMHDPIAARASSGRWRCTRQVSLKDLNAVTHGEQA